MPRQARIVGSAAPWIRKDPKSGEYGLRRWTVADDDGYPTDALVIEPYQDEELGIDFASIGPEWIREAGHGTILLLLGNTGTEDTITGAPGRDESQREGLSTTSTPDSGSSPTMSIFASSIL